MDAIHEELEYLDNGDDPPFTRGHYSLMTSHSDQNVNLEDATELKQNLRGAMKRARQRIANLRLDLEEKDNLFQAEKSLRQQLEVELAEKATEICKQREMKLPGENGLYSPEHSHFTDSLRNDQLYREELAAAQNLNFQLSKKLAKAESEIQASRMSCDDLVAQTDSKIAARGAALVERIYHAQKERDLAMNARLKIAQDEREELLDKIRTLEMDYMAGFDSGVDTVYEVDEREPSMKALLGGIMASESPESIDKHALLIFNKLKTIQRNKKKMVTEELKAVIAERDTAFQKAKALEAEVINVRKELEMMKNQHKEEDRHQLKAVQMQSLQAQQERDAALKKMKRLEEEMESIRVYYSLHRSLSQEKSLRDQFNTTMDNFEGRLRARDSDLLHAQQSYDEVVEKLKAVSLERNNLARQLEEASKTRQQQKERADKLERLVGVLRKRISESGGTSVATIN